MRGTSQSRHFNLQWVERATDWLIELEKLAPQNLREHWAWLCSHHQILTLAKRSEREAGLSVLWFIVSIGNGPIALGALLPQSRVILVANPIRSGDPSSGLKEFLEAKVRNLEVMGTKTDLEALGFYREDNETESKSVVRLRQKSWGKILAERPPTVDEPQKPHGTPPEKITMVSRRAIATDRDGLKRWARSFVIDTGEESTSTEREVLEWLRRGRMVIFEAPNPVGMTALSGDYICPKLGPIGRLSLVFVDPNLRGRGYGKQMLIDIENELRLESLKGVVLFSDSGNEKVSKFYLDSGFTAFDEWLSVKTTG